MTRSGCPNAIKRPCWKSWLYSLHSASFAEHFMQDIAAARSTMGSATGDGSLNIRPDSFPVRKYRFPALVGPSLALAREAVEMLSGQVAPAADLALTVLGPAVASHRLRYQADAIDRAGWQAKFATGAVGGNHRVHELAAADDGIDRTGIDALAATDAGVFIDDCSLSRTVRAAIGIENGRWTAEQFTQCPDRRVIAGWAAVDVGFALGDGLGVITTARITAACALGLGQQGIDRFNRGVGHVCTVGRGVTSRACPAARRCRARG